MTASAAATEDGALFDGGGEARRLARAVDWGATPLGPVDGWTVALRAMVRVCMDSPTPLSIWAGPDFTLIHNDAYVPILAQRRSSAMGRPAREVWAEVWHQIGPEMAQVVATGTGTRHLNAEFLLLRGGREEKAFFTYTFSPIREPDGRVVGIFNVSEETTGIEQARQQTEESYLSLFNAIDQGFCIIEVIFEGGRPVDYRFLEVNPAFAKQTGLHDVVGRTAREVVPGTESHWFEVYGDVATSGRSRRFDLPAQGLGRHYEVYAFRIGAPDRRRVAVLFSDVTERKRAEQAVTAQRDELQAILRSAMDGVWIVDTTGRLLEANEAACAMLGCGRAEMLAMSVGDVEALETPEETARHIRQITREGRDRFESRHRRKDGALIDVEVSVQHLPFGDGHIVCFIRDVTLQRRAEEQLRQSQRLESVGRLAGGVAHDFNNLLTVILSLAEEGIDEQRKGKAVEKGCLEEIGEAARRGADLTRQLLAFARKQVVVAETLDLNEQIRTSKKLLRRVIGEDVHLEERLEEGLWPVRVDPGLLGQVILNLAVNARDAMPGGGTLTLSTANVTLSERDMPPEPGMPTGDYVRFDVDDTGSGMAPEVLEHAFEPFFTTKEQGKGTGLGLSTVYGIAKQSGAFLRVRSEPGAGSSFEIYFPRQQVAGPSAPPVRSAAANGTETILVVEDEAGVRSVAVAALRAAGHRVLAAASAEEVAALLPAQGDGVQLLLTDVVMPGRSGVEVARIVQERCPSVRVLYMSGYAGEALREVGDGVNIIAKPFTPSGLRARVREVLDKPAPRPG